jgi:hypothetical protein
MMTAPETERRVAQRRTTLKGGRIVFNAGRSTLDATVRNLSRDGAKLMMTTVIGVPDNFDLMLPNTTRQPCRAVWRKGREMGIVFVTAH